MSIGEDDTYTLGNCTWLGLPFEVSIRHTISWRNALAVYFGLWPMTFVFICVFFTLITRRLSWTVLKGLGIWIVFAEQVLARIIGQRRPPGSCAPQDSRQGMPSGHASHDTGFPLYIWFELLTNEKFTHYQWWKKFILILISGIMWIPGIPSRVYLHDHTINQVIVGSFVGAILSFLYMLFIKFWFRPKGVSKLMNSKFAKKFRVTNDYLAPFGQTGENFEKECELVEKDPCNQKKYEKLQLVVDSDESKDNEKCLNENTKNSNNS